MKVYLTCGGYYTNFDYPKSLTVVNGEKLIDRTIRLFKDYEKDYNAQIIVCCNPEETAFDSYNPLRCKFTYDHVKGTGCYLDLFDAVPFEEECIFLFGDVYYSELALDRIIYTFEHTDRNIFICNNYPFNAQHLRQGEPFGWIVKDVEEFKAAILLCKRFQYRGIVNDIRNNRKGGIPTNWELAHVINGFDVNAFCLRKEDCLIIDDITIDVDEPSSVKRLEERIHI